MARERKFSLEELFQTTKQLLLDYGYEGFTFSLLADQLEVARGHCINIMKIKMS